MWGYLRRSIFSGVLLGHLLHILFGGSLAVGMLDLLAQAARGAVGE